MKEYEMMANQTAVNILHNEKDFAVNISFAFKVHGRLDKGRFEKALQKTIDENDAFRFKFHKDELTGKVFQYVVDHVDYSLDERDTVGDTYQERYEDVKRQTYRLLSEVECFSDCLMWDFVLFDMGKDEYIFYARMNHLVCDGVSAVHVVRKIVANYNGIPYRQSGSFEEYINEHEEFKASERFFDMESVLNLSIEKYRNYNGILNLTDTNREPSSMGYFTTIDSAEIAQFCRKNKINLFSVTLFFLHLALSISYGQPNTLVTVVSGNRSVKYTSTIGCLIEACFSELSLDDDTTFKEALIECRDDFFKSIKFGPIYCDFVIKNSIGFETVLTYQNQVKNFNSQVLPLGDATAEDINDPQLIGFPQENEINAIFMSGMESNDMIVYGIDADKKAFPDELKELSVKVFHLAQRCLISNEDISIGEFKKLLNVEK